MLNGGNYFKCCKGCIRRHPGCSSKCQDYAQARARYDADAEKYRKWQRGEVDYAAGKMKRVLRAKKRTGR